MRNGRRQSATGVANIARQRAAARAAIRYRGGTGRARLACGSIQRSTVRAAIGDSPGRCRDHRAHGTLKDSPAGACVINLRMEEALPARIALGNTFLVEADPARGTGLAGFNRSATGLALEGIGVHRDGPAAALVDWRARRLRCRHAVRAVERPAIGTAVTGGS